jgi:hypothetical protein
MLELENENLNENIISNFANQLFDNIKTTKEIADFYKKLLTNNNALQYYLTQIKDSIVRNINKINNNYLHKLLTTLNNTVSLKNLVYLSVLSCATSFYIINYNKIPDLVQFFVEILNSKVLNSISIDNIIQFFEMLIKIVGSIVFVYKVLIEPYKNQILSMVGKFNLNKQNTMTESKFTNYKKRKMNKVLITESQLRGMVRKMLVEERTMGGTAVGTPQAQTSQQPKIGSNAQQVINIINGPAGTTPLINKLKAIINPNDLTAIINFITSKTSLKDSNTATLGTTLAKNIRNVQTQAPG